MTDQPSTEPAQPAVQASGEDRWISDATRELAAAMATLRDGDEALRFLRDLCTVNELREFDGYRLVLDRQARSRRRISR